MAYLIGERWLMPCRTLLTFKLITPPRMVEMERRIDVTLTANPTCENKVQNMIPTDSPQLMIQKQLYAQIRNICALRSRLSAKAASTPNTSDEITSKGISSVVYCSMNDSAE